MSNPAYEQDRKLITDLQAKISKATASVLAEVKKQNPAYKDFAVFPQNNIYRKRKHSQTKIMKALADQLTFRGGAGRTQKEINSLVQSQFPDQKISPSIWSKKFKGIGTSQWQSLNAS